MKKIVVTGGRKYYDKVQLFNKLDLFHALYGIEMLSHGGARGADMLAGLWAKARGVPCTVYPVSSAEWVEHGNYAGNLRNIRMLEKARPDAVIAFSGGRGTAHCIASARKLKIPVAIICPAAPTP